MSRFCIISIFLCATAIGASAQPSALADSLRDAECYDLAAVEYERCVYGSTSLADTRRALEQKALCQKAAGRYAEAAQTVGRYASQPDDFYQEGLCHFLAGNYEAASGFTAMADMLSPDGRMDVLLLRMLSLNELQLYDSAVAVAVRLADVYARATGRDLRPMLDSLYAATPRLKSESTARWLSFLPGLGHAYAGEYAIGATAFVLNAAVLGFGVWQVFERCYITAYVGGAGLLSATFLGAMRSAEYYVRKYNHDRTAAFNAALKDHLLEQF